MSNKAKNPLLECYEGKNGENQKIIKSLMRSQDLVCLQESKVQQMSMQLVRSLGMGRFLDWAAMEARGVTRGILDFWDNRVLKLIGIEEGVFPISCHFKNCEDGFVWVYLRVTDSYKGGEERIYQQS